MQEQVTERTGFLFDGALDDVDTVTARVTAYEEARQVNKLIMIASESAAPEAVRQALATVFTDLYAEGYPAARATREPEALLEDIPYQLAYHERYSDRRYYKGTELADLVEILAQERIRKLFAPNRYPANGSTIGPDQIQANVQPLSGANANTAVYLGLLQAGDTIMGMNLAQGGHLSHGSPVNVSGKLFKVVAYGVDPKTGRIDYDEVERLAREHNPRMIVSGASAYPWGIDFARLRRICDNLPRKAYLLADVSHPAGLVVAGLYPNPVGIADVTTFTTHKTLIGPRAAVILTTNETLARRIDRAVFPGLQGGPHMNTIAALAVAFKIAESDAFLELQSTIVKNAQALAETLQRRGLSLAYGGTESHLLLIDLREIRKPSGVTLNGDVAARLLDLVGVVCNKNTIFGDTSATHPSGIRLGTPWITQRGLTPDDMRVLGGVIADVLLGAVTFSYFDPDESAARGKIPYELYRQSAAAIADLITRRAVGPAEPKEGARRDQVRPGTLDGRLLYEAYGRRALEFFAEATTGRIASLGVGQAVTADVLEGSGQRVATLGLLRRGADQFGRDHIVIAVAEHDAEHLRSWLQALSTGLILFDPADPWAKVDGPVAIVPFAESLTSEEAAALRDALVRGPAPADLSKPYFVGQRALAARGNASPARPLATVTAHPIAPKWSMPASYGDSAAELQAIRNGVALIDESDLGILEINGSNARQFLDLSSTNDVLFLAPGAAQYTFFLDTRGDVVTDALLYRTGPERYLVSTYQSRAAMLEQWLADLASSTVAVDVEVPNRILPRPDQIRLLGDAAGSDGLGVVGFIGPNAPALLRALADTADERRKVARIRRYTSTQIRLAGISVRVARTSHTGVAQGYELFVSRENLASLRDAALGRGAEQGIRPVGFDAWRAAGIAAGLPWIGHELGGPDRISPIEAGFGPEVRPHKPFFVGRRALLDQPYPAKREIVRLKIVAGDRSALGHGDLIVGDDGRCVGRVTSVSGVGSEPIGLALVGRGALSVGTQAAVVSGTADDAPTPFGNLIAPESTARLATIEVLPRFPK